MDDIDTVRLKTLISKKFRTQSDFAKVVNISRQGLQKVFETKSTKWSTLQKMAAELEVSAESLFVGSQIVAEPTTNYSSGLKGRITYVPVSAQAGFFIGYSQEKMKYQTFAIPDLGDGEYFAFNVIGDSMTPAVKNGDIVVCSKITDKEDIKPNAVHVMFDKTEGVVVKRLVVDGEKVRCISDNPKHPEYTVKSNAVKDVYRVRRVISSNI